MNEEELKRIMNICFEINEDFDDISESFEYFEDHYPDRIFDPFTENLEKKRDALIKKAEKVRKKYFSKLTFEEILKISEYFYEKCRSHQTCLDYYTQTYLLDSRPLTLMKIYKNQLTAADFYYIDEKCVFSKEEEKEKEKIWKEKQDDLNLEKNGRIKVKKKKILPMGPRNSSETWILRMLEEDD